MAGLLPARPVERDTEVTSHIGFRNVSSEPLGLSKFQGCRGSGCSGPAVGALQCLKALGFRAFRVWSCIGPPF